MAKEQCQRAMEGTDRNVINNHNDDITKRVCKKIGRCKPRKMPPCHTLPSHGCGCDNPKRFAQQQKW